MVYTLATHLRESLAELIRARKIRIDQEESAKAQLEEEVRTASLGEAHTGIRLTVSSTVWHIMALAARSEEDGWNQGHARVVRTVEGQV